MLVPLVLADWLETIDSINDVVSHPDFDATIHNPWFIIGSLVFCGVALFRGWKAILILYLGALAMWYVAATYVLNDHSGAQGGTSIFYFAGGVVVIGGAAIYFLLIRN